MKRLLLSILVAGILLLVACGTPTTPPSSEAPLTPSPAEQPPQESELKTSLSLDLAKTAYETLLTYRKFQQFEKMWPMLHPDIQDIHGNVGEFVKGMESSPILLKDWEIYSPQLIAQWTCKSTEASICSDKTYSNVAEIPVTQVLTTILGERERSQVIHAVAVDNDWKFFIGKTKRVPAPPPPVPAPVPVPQPHVGPIILGPPGGSTTSTTPRIYWAPFPGATKYQVILATDPFLKNRVAGTPLFVAVPAWQPAEALKKGTTYFLGITAVEPNVSHQSVGTFQTISPTPAPTPALTPGTKIDREAMVEIFKANASAKWGNDYQMVNYEVDKQTEAYDWVVKQTEYPNIIERAKQEWGNDYTMVKYEYEKQAEAYEWIMRQTAYPDIMERAKQKWGGDYTMVKYEYEKQVKAYKALQ